MHLSKNKKYQYSFFFFILIYSIFNGGNSNLLIQINFLLISNFYIICLRDKNYSLHFRYFIKNNRNSVYFYILFLLYLLFQILPLPIELLKFFSPEIGSKSAVAARQERGHRGRVAVPRGAAWPRGRGAGAWQEFRGIQITFCLY